MIPYIRLVGFALAAFFLSSVQALASDFTEYKLESGQTVSGVVFDEMHNAQYWQNDAVVVLHKNHDVTYAKDDTTMRHLPIGTRVRIFHPIAANHPAIDVQPSQSIATTQVASTTGISLVLDTVDAGSHVPAASVAALDLRPIANTPKPQHSLWEWLMLVGSTFGLVVCAFHGFAVWRESRRRRRFLYRPVPHATGEAVLPKRDRDIEFVVSIIDVKESAPPQEIDLSRLEDRGWRPLFAKDEVFNPRDMDTHPCPS